MDLGRKIKIQQGILGGLCFGLVYVALMAFFLYDQTTVGWTALTASAIAFSAFVASVRRIRKNPELRSALASTIKPVSDAENSASAFGFLFGMLPGLSSFLVFLVVFDNLVLAIIGIVAGLLVAIVIRSGLISGFKAVKQNTPATSARSTKRCPFCAEDVLLEAVKCKHCGEQLPNSSV